jgi:hypothetical protein
LPPNQIFAAICHLRSVFIPQIVGSLSHSWFIDGLPEEAGPVPLAVIEREFVISSEMAIESE